MGAPALGTTREGCEPGSDPRYSCGWHYRKNKFTKERRQFERMSSFETQAAGLARPGSPRPPPLHYAARGPEASAALPSQLSPPLSPPKDAQKPPGVHSCKRLVPAGFWVSPWPRRRPAPTPRAGGERAPACPGVRGAQARGLGASAAPGDACARGRVGECARARGCVSLSVSRLGSSALAGPPGLLFPGSQPGPPPS